jgi:arginase family enzyme
MSQVSIYLELRKALFALAERTDVIGFDLVEVNFLQWGQA